MVSIIRTNESIDEVEDSSHIDPAPPSVKRLIVTLIKPSRYDDDGYIVRHWRGVLPSNTLACLDGLTGDVADRKLLGEHIEVETRLFDETVESVPVRRIARWSRDKNVRLIVGLVGVQSNQFARARDLARELRSRGVSVMVGGFHVSGMIAMFPQLTSDITEMIDMGVTVVAGEVEDKWSVLLSDVVNDRLQPLYNFLTSPPDLARKPLPRVSKDYMKKFAIRYMGTIDTSRGCPFNCSFCTIINVQGRKMRCREAENMRHILIDNYAKGITHYFFTDDNFSRNKNWRPILEELIAVREQGYNIGFMMQIDTIAYRIPGFVELASRAGCSQVFIGMESINQENLKAAGKTQNDVSDYAHMAKTWHDAGVATHVGYIIGFPFDTPESVREDVRRLSEEVGIQQASFFMLTPLPGSVDHKRAVETGANLDTDFNNYDSFHAAMDHPRMTREEWVGAYQDAWHDFYTIDHMKRSLRAISRRLYWSLFGNYMWYKHSILVDGTHPMVTGFVRIKGRRNHRPEVARQPVVRYWAGRVREFAHDMKMRFKLMYELQELWLQTRRRTETEIKVADFLNAVARQTARARLHVSDWQEAFVAATGRAPSRVRLFFGRMNILSLRWTYTRQDLDNYWKTTREQIRRGAILRVNWLRAAWNVVRDVTITSRFALALAFKR